MAKSQAIVDGQCFYDSSDKVVRWNNEYLLHVGPKQGFQVVRDVIGILNRTLGTVPATCCFRNCKKPTAYAHRLSDFWIAWCEDHQGVQLSVNKATEAYFPEGIQTT